MRPSIQVYDTTLRDGSQGEGVSFTVADKLEIVSRLDALRVDYIEGGWPGANDKDLAFFYQLKDLPLAHSKVVAFTSTRKKHTRIEEDAHMRMVLGTGLQHCAVFGKTWDFQVREALRTDLSENLRMIGDTIGFLKGKGIEAIFDAEHFFDGYKDNPSYALAALAAARDAGADWLVLCDTNGGSLPHEVADIVKAVREAGFTQIGIHAHNDGGLAVANSLAAVRAGATQVQGTMNGFGERCGNADLCVLLPNLVLKCDASTSIGPEGVRMLKDLSTRLYVMTGKPPVASQPFVGRSAFAHKAGVHVSAIRRDPRLYEHLPPDFVGNERRVLLSELSGVSNVLYQLEAMGITAHQQTVDRILARLKAAERLGYVFEEARTSLALLIREETNACPVSVRWLSDTCVRTQNGYTVTLRFEEQMQELREVHGGGMTIAGAMCHALGLLSVFTVIAEDVLAVQGEAGSTLCRARVHGNFSGEELCTVGLADNEGTAMAHAMLQIYQYIRISLALCV